MYVLRLIPTNIYWVPLCAGLHYVVEEFDLASFLKKKKKALILNSYRESLFTQTIHKEVSFFKSSPAAHYQSHIRVLLSLSTANI